MKKLPWILLGVAFTAIPAAIAATVIFSDISEDDWYYDAVESLYRKGIVEGYEDDTYQPANNVNRAEMAVILDRLIEYLGDSCVEDGEFYLPGEGYEVGSETTGWTGYECQDGEIIEAWVADPELE